jgi:RNA polymerase sigma-32 factor
MDKRELETQELVQRYSETHDPRIEARLVELHRPLVYKIAHQYRPSPNDLEDLVQEGSVGLLIAIRRFDPKRGVKLPSFAGWWIRALQMRWLINNHRLVKIGTTQSQRNLFFNLRGARARLEAAGIEPTAERIAERLGVEASDVEMMAQRLAARETSLEAPSRRDPELRALAALPSPEVPADELVAELEERAILHQEIEAFRDMLSGRERDLFQRRWMRDEQQTLGQIGHDYDISRERARQIESAMLGKLRQRVEKRLKAA